MAIPLILLAFGSLFVGYLAAQWCKDAKGKGLAQQNFIYPFSTQPRNKIGRYSGSSPSRKWRFRRSLIGFTKKLLFPFLGRIRQKYEIPIVQRIRSAIRMVPESIYDPEFPDTSLLLSLSSLEFLLAPTVGYWIAFPLWKEMRFKERLSEISRQALLVQVSK